MHVCAKNGNSVVLEWYLEKRWEHQYTLPEINSLDKNGYSALFLAIWKGYKGKVGKENKAQIRDSRLTCAKLLIEVGADVNFVTQKLEMTPLHWAAYWGD